ncbi:MAG: hypothetical protein IT307_12645 [Chloroflexi bacterium]|nr:hypothetical protein [Chloroflexota bacterium]
MAVSLIDLVRTGMGAYDATGHEIGQVVDVFAESHVARPQGEEPRLTAERCFEVRLNEAFGMGRRVHVHAEDVQSVSQHCVFLIRTVRDLEGERHL